MTFTVVIPVFNAAAHIESTLDSLIGYLADHNRLFEVIAVNDASQDNTLDILYRLQERFPAIRVINLPQNAGQHAATLAGMLRSRGEVTMTMDDDVHFLDIPFEAIEAQLREEPDSLIYLVTEAEQAQSLKYRTITTLIRLISRNPNSPSIGSSQRCFHTRYFMEHHGQENNYIYLDVLFFIWGMRAKHLLTQYEKSGQHFRYTLFHRINLIGHALIFYNPVLLFVLIFVGNIVLAGAASVAGSSLSVVLTGLLLFGDLTAVVYMLHAWLKFGKALPASIRSDERG